VNHFQLKSELVIIDSSRTKRRNRWTRSTNDSPPNRSKSYCKVIVPASLTTAKSKFEICVSIPMSERWFGGITRKGNLRNVFRIVPELVTAIEDYIICTNESPTLRFGQSGLKILLTRPIIKKLSLKNFTRRTPANCPP